MQYSLLAKSHYVREVIDTRLQCHACENILLENDTDIYCCHTFICKKVLNNNNKKNSQ